MRQSNIPEMEFSGHYDGFFAFSVFFETFLSKETHFASYISAAEYPCVNEQKLVVFKFHD